MKKPLVFFIKIIALGFVVVFVIHNFLERDYHGYGPYRDSVSLERPISSCSKDKVFTFEKFEKSLQSPKEVCRLDLGPSDNNPNPITSIPASISEFSNLKELTISNLELKSISPDITKLRTLETLEISNLPLVKFPIEITELENLKVLYLYNNNFNNIPKEIGNLRNLTTFSIEGGIRSIKIIPDEIGNLYNLKALKISIFKFDGKCPSEISKLVNLEILIYSCSVSQLSPILPNLKKLKELRYEGTLTTIPDEIGELKDLEILQIYTHNPPTTHNITYISPKIGELKKLKVLSIRGSGISRKERNNLIKLLPNTNILLTVPFT